MFSTIYLERSLNEWLLKKKLYLIFWSVVLHFRLNFQKMLWSLWECEYCLFRTPKILVCFFPKLCGIYGGNSTVLRESIVTLRCCRGAIFLPQTLLEIKSETLLQREEFYIGVCMVVNFTLFICLVIAFFHVNKKNWSYVTLVIFKITRFLLTCCSFLSKFIIFSVSEFCTLVQREKIFMLSKLILSYYI